MKKYLVLAGVTVVAAILLFIFGFIISSQLSNLTTSVVGERILVLRPSESIRLELQFGLSIGVLFASCTLWAMVLYLVSFRTQSVSFSIFRYFIFLAILIISTLTGIALRLLYLASVSSRTTLSLGLSLGPLQFLKWGFVVNLIVCGAIIIFLMISRSGQSRLSEKGA